MKKSHRVLYSRNAMNLMNHYVYDKLYSTYFLILVSDTHMLYTQDTARTMTLALCFLRESNWMNIRMLAKLKFSECYNHNISNLWHILEKYIFFLYISLSWLFRYKSNNKIVYFTNVRRKSCCLTYVLIYSEFSWS